MIKPTQPTLLHATVAVFALLVSAVAPVHAFYSDTEISSNNEFAAAGLEVALTIDNEGPDTRTLRLGTGGNLPFSYTIDTSTSETNTFCGALEVVVEQNGSEIYNGPLAGFAAGAFPLGGLAEDVYMYSFSVSDESADYTGQTCTVTLTHKASQDGFNHGEAYHDTKTDTFTLLGENFGIPPEPEPETPDVVINEVMWMGSVDDEKNLYGDDEWIELRNMTGSEIDISQWTIENAKSGGSSLNIPASHTIPANGFYLIARNSTQTPTTLLSATVTTDHPQGSSLSLHNTYSDNGRLILKDAGGSVVDQTPTADTSDWSAGENVTGSTPRRWSMERNDDPTTGWHTCDRSVMGSSDLSTMQSYWNDDGQDYNCGTPGAANLSENDPSLQMMNTQEADEGEPAKENEEEESKQEDEEEEDGKKDGDDEGDNEEEQDGQADGDDEEGETEEEVSDDNTDEQGTKEDKDEQNAENDDPQNDEDPDEEEKEDTSKEESKKDDESTDEDDNDDVDQGSEEENSEEKNDGKEGEGTKDDLNEDPQDSESDNSGDSGDGENGTATDTGKDSTE